MPARVPVCWSACTKALVRHAASCEFNMRSVLCELACGGLQAFQCKQNIKQKRVSRHQVGFFCSSLHVRSGPGRNGCRARLVVEQRVPPFGMHLRLEHELTARSETCFSWSGQRIARLRMRTSECLGDAILFHSHFGHKPSAVAWPHQACRLHRAWARGDGVQDVQKR